MLGLPKPPRPPNALTQPLGPGWLILMLRAATAPMLFAVPTAVMHWPTFSADGPAVITLRYLVVAAVVTVMLAFVPAAGFLPCTTKPLADTEITLPLAPPKPPKPPNPPRPNAPPVPLGRGLGLKLGRGEEVPAGLPNPPGGRPNPPAPTQLPLTGALMVTLVAVTDRLAAVLAGGWPTTVTQLPTARSFDVTVTVSVIAVAAVKVTVTCPEVGFWTSRLDPDTAAAVPTVPGKAARVRVGAGLRPGAAELALVAAGVAGVAGVALVPPPPQAATVSATIPTPVRAGAQRRRELRPAADVPLVAAPIMVDSHPCRWSFATQRVDWGEPGGTGGGVDAEDDADADRDDDRADGGGR